MTFDLLSSSRLLDGRYGLVLGVSRRNSAGYVCADHFVSSGARLAVSFRNSATHGPELAESLAAVPVIVESDDESTIHKALSQIDAKFGRLDFILHTLVAAPPEELAGSVLDVSREAFADVMDVSVRSLLVALRMARPLLKKSVAPRVLSLTSIGAERAIKNYHVVGIAKAALNAAIRYAAAEVGPDGILCNGLSFSMVPTDSASRVIGEETTAKTMSYLERRSMTGNATSLKDVASVAAVLLSEHCVNLTGQIINVDSGFSVNSI